MSAQIVNNNSQLEAILASLEAQNVFLHEQDTRQTEQYEATVLRFESIEGSVRELQTGQDELRTELREMKSTRKSAPSPAPKAPSPKKSVVYTSPYRFPFPGQILEGCCQAIAVNSNLFSQCPKPAVEGCDGLCRACFGKSGSDQYLGHIQERVNNPDWVHPFGKKIKTAQQYLNTKTGDRITIDEYRIEAEKYYGAFGIEYEITGKELEVPKAGRPKKNSDAPSPAKNEEEPCPNCPEKQKGHIGRCKKTKKVVVIEEEEEEPSWPEIEEEHKQQLLEKPNLWAKRITKFDKLYGPGAAQRIIDEYQEQQRAEEAAKEAAKEAELKALKEKEREEARLKAEAEAEEIKLQEEGLMVFEEEEEEEEEEEDED